MIENFPDGSLWSSLDCWVYYNIVGLVGLGFPKRVSMFPFTKNGENSSTILEPPKW